MQLQLIHRNSSWLCCACSLPLPNTRLTVLWLIFCLNSILAWVMKTDLAIKLIEKWSYDYIKMDCTGGKCYGVLAVR